MHKPTKTQAQRHEELVTLLMQAGFAIHVDANSGSTVQHDGKVLESFEHKYIRAWIEKGNGSPGLLVNFFCLRAQLPYYDGSKANPF